MAIQSNFPNIRPSLLLDFANSKRLDPRVTFTRASTATYYDGVTQALAEQNLILQSQAVNDGNWGKTDATITSDSTTAPDGTSTADTVTEGVALTGLLIQGQRPNIPGTTFTASVYLKKSVNNDWVRFFCNGNTSSSNAIFGYFNLATGVVGTPVNSGTGSGGALSIVNAGSGWYRCIVSGVIGTETQLNFAIASATADGNATRIANATYFVWGAQFEQRSSVSAYTATTTATVTNYIPRLLTAAANVARFDHTPTTGASLGLLVEESRQNAFVRSDDFANASWAKTEATIASNVIIAPDGTLTGDKLQTNTNSASHSVTQDITWTSGVSYTVSCYFKAAEIGFGFITLPTLPFTTLRHNYINLATGEVTLAANTNGAAINVGNGWWRFWVSATATGTTTTVACRIGLTTSNTTPTTTGSNTWDGIYIWGAQLETGLFPTSYIPTTSAAVTRQADVASMTGTNFSSWYNASEGTLYSEYRISATAVNRQAAAISDGTGNNRIVIRADSIGNAVSLGVVGGTTQWNAGAGTVSTTALNKFSVGYKVNDIAFVYNAGAATTDTSASIPVVDRFNIGQDGLTGSGLLNGTIGKLAYYPLRVTNANLQAITG